MKRISVHSSNLRSVSYDPISRILEIEFHHIGIYQYLAVPQEIYNALMSAPSHGNYFLNHIQDVYPRQRIS